MSPAGGALVALLALLAAALTGLYRRRRDGRVLPSGRASADAAPSQQSQALVALGVSPGRTTLVQFSSAFCAPCRVARRVCADVAAAMDVAHLEVDAESHLDEVRRLGIWRTPTVLVVDPAGRVTHRVTGPPARAELLAAIA
ncbi:MAG: thioredoxin family protein [Micromonosporaceae bacterium]|nr:thioredoxin family protein [Micromonosporaceae bacterium]